MGSTLFTMSKPDSQCAQPFFDAVAKGDKAMVRSLLRRHLLEAVDKHGATALFIACKNRRHRIAKLLLDSGAAVDTRCGYRRETALHVVAQYGREDTVALLLSRGADVHQVNNYGDTALHLAVKEGSEDTVALLLSRGADVRAVTDSGETALHLAASVGSVNKASMLLSYGSVVDSVARSGLTELAGACMGGKSEVANLLIRSGADIHWVGASGTDVGGYTLVHAAAKGDLGAMIQLLLDLKAADVDAVCEDGRTALHMACSHWSINAARCLLKNAAQVNYVCRESVETAFHIAARNESPELIKLLRKYGADFEALDNEGQTPFSSYFENPDIVDYCGLFQMGKACLDRKSDSTVINEIFIKELVKMKEQNIFLRESTVKILFENYHIQHFRESCEDEIRRMRVSWIGDSNVKMYDFLTKGVNCLSDYVSNDVVERVLKSENYKAEFPIYASEIHEKFLQGKERRDLLRQSCEWLWSTINEFYEIPYVLVERINRCLTNDDLALQISRVKHKVSPILLS